MLKKALFVLALALTFVTGSVQANDPLPTCDPCPWVR